ncbi:hypothetical protein DYB32_010044, partial [Aphanomyces invadans]
TDPSPMRRINKIYVTTRRASGELHLQSVLQHMDRRLQVLPDLVMFSGTFGLMILSVCVLLVLLSQNMFERQVINLNAQLADTYHWAPYGQSCVLRADGFVPDSYGTAQHGAVLSRLQQMRQPDRCRRPFSHFSHRRRGVGNAMAGRTQDRYARFKQYVYANSDGTSQNLISKVRRIVIAGDGNVGMDAFGGTNNVITSKPLGERYD